ncbi:lactonase family protein [Paenibacillaceae bacterium]|nr:lactonase family protein [Paenibacillaceae bacterium]
MSEQRLLILVGSYSEAADNGIHTYSLDAQNGKLQKLGELAGLKNPTFLNVDASNSRLYSIAEGVSEQGERTAEAVAIAYNANTGELQETSRALGLTASACHVLRDTDNRFLLLSSYGGGRVGLVGLKDDGEIGEIRDIKQHEGRSVNVERQQEPHPHSAAFSPDGRYVFVPDLGIDRIRTYSIDVGQGTLKFHHDNELHPGAGPRHMVFHPGGQFAYVINELDSTITAFSYNAEEGRLSTIETVSTLPADYTGESDCAEIAVSEDGKFLYGSNRGHDSIAVYGIDAATGKLALVQHVSVEGAHPRHFALMPGGQLLLVANRDTNNITVFRVERDTGRLQFTGHSETVSKPVCIVSAQLDN